MSCRKGKYKFKLRLLSPEEEAAPGTLFTMESDVARGVILEVALPGKLGFLGVNDIRTVCEGCWFYHLCVTEHHDAIKKTPKCFNRSDHQQVWFREIGKL